MKKHSAKIKSNILIVLLICILVIVAVTAIVKLDVTGKKGSGLGKEFLYDIKFLEEIDPELILYELAAEYAVTGLNQTHAIALDSKDNIYVAGDNAVKIINGGTVELSGHGRCLALTNDGKIYVGLKDHIEVFDKGHNRLAAWDSLGENATLTSIAVDKNDVFAADAGNRVIVRYDMQGNIINYIGRKDPDRNIPGFVIPSPFFDLAMGRDGLLRVVNPGMHRIEAYTFEGDLEFFWGKPSAAIEDFCGCCNPVNFAIAEDETFITCEKGLVLVKVYDHDGGFTGVVAGPEQLLKDSQPEIKAVAFDVAVDKAGKIYVLDTNKNIVKVFTKK